MKIYAVTIAQPLSDMVEGLRDHSHQGKMELISAQINLSGHQFFADRNAAVTEGLRMLMLSSADDNKNRDGQMHTRVIEIDGEWRKYSIMDDGVLDEDPDDPEAYIERAVVVEVEVA